MINQIYQLTKTKVYQCKIPRRGLLIRESYILIRPNYMAGLSCGSTLLSGKRDPKILNNKLPMAMIHESCGTVISDPTGTYEVGQKQ